LCPPVRRRVASAQRGDDRISLADRSADAARDAPVVGGVDCHARAHHAVALGGRGRLGECAFPTTRTGYAPVLGWLRRFGAVQVVGVESTGAYGAGLTRALTGAGVRVVEVNQPHPHTRHRRGKSDAVDAEGRPKEVLRCLKRYIAREVCHALRADLAAAAPSAA
jgi:transposase